MFVYSHEGAAPSRQVAIVEDEDMFIAAAYSNSIRRSSCSLPRGI